MIKLQLYFKAPVQSQNWPNSISSLLNIQDPKPYLQASEIIKIIDTFKKLMQLIKIDLFVSFIVRSSCKKCFLERYYQMQHNYLKQTYLEKSLHLCQFRPSEVSQVFLSEAVSRVIFSPKMFVLINFYGTLYQNIRSGRVTI